MRKILLAGVAATGLLMTGHANATVVTNPIYGNNSYDSYLFAGQESAVGAVITATSSADVLNDFSFYLDSTAADSYRLYVFNFNTTTGTIVGSSVYTSSVFTTNSGTNTDIVGNVNLVDGNQYLVMISDSGLTNSTYTRIRPSTTATYKSYYTNNTATPGDGEKLTAYSSLGFTADLSSGSTATGTVSGGASNDTSVPEPGFMVGLLGLAFFGMAGLRRGYSRQVDAA